VTAPLRIGVIGLGKIALDQHLPAIAADPRFTLAATVERAGTTAGINFTSHQAMLAGAALDAVAITTPPGPRYAIARDCIEAGLHVLLEKPPTVTLAEIDDLATRAARRGVTLFTTWHAQHNPAVVAAAALLAGQTVREMSIVWHEDVDKWHPGQQWIWRAGGFGVFDPGINAFSIVAKIFPGTLAVSAAALFYPPQSDTPIAAEIRFASAASVGRLSCSLDWRKSAGEQWTIALTTAAGQAIELGDGGARLMVDGEVREAQGGGEYASIYCRFADLVARGESEVDMVPLRLVADCLLVGSRHPAEVRSH
jgi:predicted dehydrogenase